MAKKTEADAVLKLDSNPDKLEGEAGRAMYQSRIILNCQSGFENNFFGGPKIKS